MTQSPLGADAHSLAPATDYSSTSSWPRRALEAEKTAHYQTGLLKREQQLRAEQEQALGVAWSKLAALAEAEAAAQTERSSAVSWALVCEEQLLREQEGAAALEASVAQARAQATAEAHARVAAQAQADATLERERARAAKENSTLCERLGAAEEKLASLATDEAVLRRLLAEAKAEAQAQARVHADALDRANAALKEEQALRRRASEDLERERQEALRERQRADSLQSELSGHARLLNLIAAAASGQGVAKSCVPSPDSGSIGGGVAAAQALQSIHRLTASLSQEDEGDKENRF